MPENCSTSSLSFVYCLNSFVSFDRSYFGFVCQCSNTWSGNRLPFKLFIFRITSTIKTIVSIKSDKSAQELRLVDCALSNEKGTSLRWTALVWVRYPCRCTPPTMHHRQHHHQSRSDLHLWSVRLMQRLPRHLLFRHPIPKDCWTCRVRTTVFWTARSRYVHFFLHSFCMRHINFLKSINALEANSRSGSTFQAQLTVSVQRVHPKSLILALVSLWLLIFAQNRCLSVPSGSFLVVWSWPSTFSSSSTCLHVAHIVHP